MGVGYVVVDAKDAPHVGQNDDPLPIASPQFGHLLLPIIRLWPIVVLGVELKKIAVLLVTG